MGMETITKMLLAVTLTLSAPALVSASAFEQLSGGTANSSGEEFSAPVPAFKAQLPAGMKMAVQPLPPDNDAPGIKMVKVGKPGTRTVVMEFPGTVKAFLDTIAYAEGTGDRYDYIFSFATFTDFSDHPRRVICDGLCSDAAGRYQFLSTTWDGIKDALGLPDFSPASQDKGCVELIRRRYAAQLVEDADNYYNFTAAIEKLGAEWASLPGSPYGQPTHDMDELWNVYLNARQKYK